MGLTALWWWIDRWRKSTAYTDLSLEAQAAYRNLLDEAWLRRGVIPNNDRILAKSSGDATRWPEVRDDVLAHFRLTKDGWHNDTLDAVLAQSVRRATNQANYRARYNGPANALDNAHDNGRANNPASPDPSPDPSLLWGDQKGKGTGKGKRKKRNNVCPHAPRCASRHACIELTLTEARQLRQGR